MFDSLEKTSLPPPAFFAYRRFPNPNPATNLSMRNQVKVPRWLNLSATPRFNPTSRHVPPRSFPTRWCRLTTRYNSELLLMHVNSSPMLLDKRNMAIIIVIIVLIVVIIIVIYPSSMHHQPMIGASNPQIHYTRYTRYQPWHFPFFWTKKNTHTDSPVVQSKGTWSEYHCTGEPQLCLFVCFFSGSKRHFFGW